MTSMPGDRHWNGTKDVLLHSFVAPLRRPLSPATFGQNGPVTTDFIVFVLFARPTPINIDATPPPPPCRGGPKQSSWQLRFAPYLTFSEAMRSDLWNSTFGDVRTMAGWTSQWRQRRGARLTGDNNAAADDDDDTDA